MGCCLGTTAQTPSPLPHHRPNGPKSRHFHARSLATEPDPTHIEKTQLRAPPQQLPPPPVVEEESVKEVLSETPISKTQIPKIPLEQNTHSPPKLQVSKQPIDKELSEEPPSQASEACGVSESYSYSTTTTTTTIADAREDEATSKRKREVGQRDRVLNGPLSSTSVRRKRPYSGELAGRRERGAKLPATAPEPSMGKKNRTETRSFRGRESGQMRTMKHGAGPTGVRRDTVSSRSRSPATRTAGGVGRGVARSPAEVTGRAGGSSSSSQPGAVKSDEGKTKKEAESSDGVSQQQQGNENLELECFIFV